MSQAPFSVGIYTLGCKVNQYESEAIAERLTQYGLRLLPPSAVCDAYVINTCTVTAESDRKARQFIRRAISKNPNARVVVTGCLAQAAPETLLGIAGIDTIIGNASKLLVADEILRLLNGEKKDEPPRVLVENIDDAPFESMRITGFNRTRAYVKIEDGCENRCTYCIIPYARGKVRSKPTCEVVREVRSLTENGCREIVLTGIETASYGKDLADASLVDLLKAIDRIPGIGRIRLGSLDPSLIRLDFAREIAELSSLAPHFHLSLQSGSSRILAQMKRKYNAEQAMRAIELLREFIPNVKFTTDIIVGFPGETEEDFEETLTFVKRARFLSAHVFPYSKRKGTPAASMKNQIAEDVKRRRLHELETLVDQIRRELLEEELSRRSTVSVLFETYENGYAYGHTEDFLEIAVPSSESLHGRIMTVRLQRTDGRLCYGALACDASPSVND